MLLMQLNWQSITGFIIVYGGAVVAYRAKLQTTVATSSTEAEFIATVYTAKAVKYLCLVLSNLNLLLANPANIYEDNKAAINMINNSKPTAQSWHIDVQHFAIQEWQNWGEIEMKHIPRASNQSCRWWNKGAQ